MNNLLKKIDKILDNLYILTILYITIILSQLSFISWVVSSTLYSFIIILITTSALVAVILLSIYVFNKFRKELGGKTKC